MLRILFVGTKFVKSRVNKASVTRMLQIRRRKGNVVKRNLSTTEKNVSLKGSTAYSDRNLPTTGGKWRP
jgi:hypothetical protein